MNKAAFLLLAVLCLWVGKSSGAERAAWKSDWEKTVQAAKQEGKIFIYAALGPYHADIFAEFQKDYPEIKGYRDEKQKSEAAWEREVMGEEFSYSLKEGCARRSLDTLMEYQIQQGILDQKPEVEDLFFPETLQL